MTKEAEGNSEAEDENPWGECVVEIGAAPGSYRHCYFIFFKRME